jgi:hypothetical protein
MNDNFVKSNNSLSDMLELMQMHNHWIVLVNVNAFIILSCISFQSTHLVILMVYFTTIRQVNPDYSIVSLEQYIIFDSFTLAVNIWDLNCETCCS